MLIFRNFYCKCEDGIFTEAEFKIKNYGAPFEIKNNEINNINHDKYYAVYIK